MTRQTTCGGMSIDSSFTPLTYTFGPVLDDLRHDNQNYDKLCQYENTAS